MREKLIDLIQEYQLHYGISEDQAIEDMRRILQAKKKTSQAIQSGRIQAKDIGKYQTI